MNIRYFFNAAHTNGTLTILIPPKSFFKVSPGIITSSFRDRKFHKSSLTFVNFVSPTKIDIRGFGKKDKSDIFLKYYHQGFKKKSQKVKLPPLQIELTTDDNHWFRSLILSLRLK